MGLYLNQLPQTEVARLKAELAETLIANFCYPRFYDYRVNALRMRPVDRVKRQEVWQYLNAVDFNVWGRVEVDSPDFQRQVERLFIHFVQRNRSFFGEQGRKRMADVRMLITHCSLTLADGLRNHLQGKEGNPLFGSPRAVSSWSVSRRTGESEPQWEQFLSETLVLQQQLQEVRGEIAPASTPLPAEPAIQPSTPPLRPGTIPARRPRLPRPVVQNNAGEGYAVQEDHLAESRPGKSAGEALPTAFPQIEKQEFAQAGFPSIPASPDAAPTLPLPLSKPERMTTALQPAPVEVSPTLSSRSRRGRPGEVSPALQPPSGPLNRRASRPLAAAAPSAVPVPPPAVPAVRRHSAGMPAVRAPQGDAAIGPAEHGAALASDEDMVIFEQMRHQLMIWLRVEAVRAGIELGSQNTFQLMDALRHQDSVDTARLQVVSTLLNMCDQIITRGRATLLDYKQAMMFYLMHTRRSH